MQQENTNITNPVQTETDNSENENKFRPTNLESFIGQSQIKENLNIFINAARKREGPLDHTLLYGPPGLGKTTLAQIISKEMGVNFKTSSGPILSKAADLAAILTNLEENDVLFIDEIHRLNTAVEEVLYSALEDFVLDIVIGEGPAARSVRINLPKFTLIGATTRLGLLSNPLRDRFGIPLRLSFYEFEELQQVVTRGAHINNLNCSQDGCAEIAKRSRGTPRISLRLLNRVSDFAIFYKKEIIDKEIADLALDKLGVDKKGLDSNDLRYLRFLIENYKGGPVGLDTIAAGLSEQKDAIEDTIEPYLLQCGFLQRTPRGRIVTEHSYSHLGLENLNGINSDSGSLF